MGGFAAAIPMIKTVATVVGAVSSLSSAFGGQEAPSLPPPPPVPTPEAVPASVPQVSDSAETKLADEEARNRAARQRKAATQNVAATKDVTAINRKASTLLGD